MTPIPKYRQATLEERVAVLESEITVLADVQRDLAQLMRDHMEREEETTRRVIHGITAIEQRMSRWHGMALGVAAAVSAGWALLLAALTLLK